MTHTQHSFTLTVEEDGLALIDFNDPDSGQNLLSADNLLELKSLLHDAEERSDITSLLFHSTKENAFIAGADINAIENISGPEEASQVAAEGEGILRQIHLLPYPTAALITGHCLGGGFELTLACDYRVAVDDGGIRIGLPEVNLGIIPGFGGTQRLPRLIGLTKALPLILQGKTISPGAAYKKGMVDHLVKRGFHLELAKELLREKAPSAAFNKKVRERRNRGRGYEKLPFMAGVIFSKAKKELMRKTRGNYPAPLAALEAIKKGWRKSVVRGLEIENSLFSTLAGGEISRNLIKVFHLSEKMKKQHFPEEDSLKRKYNSAAVIGAGTMGGAIAWLFTKADMPVRLKDINWDAVSKGEETIRNIYGILIKKKNLSRREAELKENLVTRSLDYSGFSGIDFALEAVIEKTEIKQSVYSDLEQVMKPDGIIATNTSSLSVSVLAEKMEHPERFVGMHYFNPPNRMPLVEIIPGAKTSEESVARAEIMARRLGKIPVVVGDSPGFLVNRLLMPYLNRAVRLSDDGVSFTEIDRAMEEYGWPMGPFHLLDVIGLDVAYKVGKILEKDFGDRMELAPSFSRVVNDLNLLGEKGGKGFYIYETGKKRTPDTKLVTGSKRMSKDAIQAELMSVMKDEAVRCLDEKVARSKDDINMSMILGAGYPPFRGGLLE